jgi:protein SCO1/2
MRPKQTLLLGLLLLVPVLGFLFLNTFGTNRYALPTYLPDHVDSTLVEGKWQRDTVFHQLGDFQLASQSGRVISQKDLAGTAYVASFFYSTCVGACPQMNSELARVQEQFRHEPRVKLVSYSVDTEHDSTAVLARYAERYGAIAGKWFFLTGDKPQVYRLITEDYRLPAPTGVAPGLVHSQQLFLIDRKKRIRGIYDGTKPKEVNRLITEIGVLLYTYDHDDAARH